MVNGKKTHTTVFVFFVLFCFTHISSSLTHISSLTYLLAAAGAGFFLGGGGGNRHPANSRAAIGTKLRLVELDGGRARK